MSKRRTAAAVAVFAGLYLVLTEASSHVGTTMWSSRDAEIHVFWLASAFAGALVARTRFFVPAIATWATLWALSVASLYQIAATVGQSSVVGIIKYNALGLGLSLAAVLLGVLGGQLLAARRRARTPVAA